MLTCLVSILFTFYIQGVLKLKKNNSGAKGLTESSGAASADLMILVKVFHDNSERESSTTVFWKGASRSALTQQNKLTNTRQHNRRLLEYAGYMFRPVNGSSSDLQQSKSRCCFRYWEITEMITRSISWGKGGRCVRLTLPPSCAVVM